MTAVGRVIINPLSGERITIRRTAAETGGSVLEWEQELLEVAAGLAQRQHAAGRALPSPFELALFMRDFEREVRAPYLPVALVRAVTTPLAWLTRRLGLDARYRLLRGPGSRDRARRGADVCRTGPVPPAAR